MADTQTSPHRIIALGGIQRIRTYYSTLLPGADYFFPQPTDRTAVNELLDIGTRASWRALVFTTASSVLTVNCVVASTGITLAVHQWGLSKPAAVTIGVLVGLVLFVALASYQIRQFRRVKAAVAAAS